MVKKKSVHVEEFGGTLDIQGVNKESGEPVDTSVLSEAGVAFDPAQMHLDLTKAEKRRTTALILAIQAYDKLIIKDAEYLREAHTQARSDGSVIRPATMDAMVLAALQFDAFISGKLVPQSGIERDASTVEQPHAVDAVDPPVDSTAVEPRT